jgi:pilus assembly protein CpaB
VQRDQSGKPISATTVTRAVTPEEAERLAIAMNTGSIQLVLRGYGESQNVATKGATSGDVLSQLKGGMAAPAKPAVQAVAPKARVLFRPPPAQAQVPAAKPTPPPPPPDSATVNVYRAGKSEKQKFDTATKR